ncbi:MAG: signal peptide peptidase SppA [Anaerolineae bacterium]|nr:signal peptide peptidase SppA [Anaerolineae bacterium]
MSVSSPLDNQSLPVQPEPRKRPNWLVLWIVAVFLLVFVAPLVGCGACGLAFAAAGSQPQSVGIGPAVGVVRVEGTIVSGVSSSFSTTTYAGSDTIVDLINQANSDPEVKAIVLRINSPGGEVVASDEIYNAVLNVDKPVVVSMGAMAASGGYYIAAPADYIIANQHTLTGSIGVISQFITAEELLDELGVDVVVITAGDSKDFGSMYRDMTEEEKQHWAAMIEETHAAFIQIVADGRGMSVDDVRALADGSVYSGQQAVDLGLVDELGYYEDAITKAASLGQIEGEPRVVEFAPQPTFWETFYGVQAQQAEGLSLENILRQAHIPSLEFRYLGR